MDDQKKYSKGIFLILFFFAIVLGAALLKITASFTLPIIVAVLLSFVLYPMVKRLYTIGIPWIAGVLISVIFVLALCFAVGNLLYISSKAVLNVYPKYEEKFTQLFTMGAKLLNIPFDEDSSLGANLWKSLEVRNFVQDSAIAVSNFLISGAKVFFIVALLVVFLLIEMKNMTIKIKIAFPNNKLSHKIIFISMKTITEVTHYLSIKFCISLLTGLLVFACCKIIGQDFAVIWGFIAFVLNFIPNFGSIFSWVITTIFALLQFYPDCEKVIFIAIAILLINFTLGNVIEPRIEGSGLGISPFIILVSLSLWGYIWGFIGMVLAVPVLVIIKIICENIDMLKPVAIILGNSESALLRRKNKNFKEFFKSFFRKPDQKSGQ